MDRPTKVKILNNAAFSLLEVIVVLGIVSIIVLLTATLSTNLFKHAGNVSGQLDRLTLQNQIINVLKKSTACRVNFANNGVNLGATPSLLLTSIKDYNESGLLLSDIVTGLNVPIYAGSRLQINTMRLTGPTGVGAPALIKTETASLIYMGSLRVTFVNVPGEVRSAPILIPSVRIKTNIAGVAQSCALEKVVNLLKTCEAVLGLTKDPGTGDCLPMNANAKAGLCASLGGVQSALPWSCQLPTNWSHTFSCPTLGEVVVGFTNGVPNCQVVQAPETWSPWGPCLSGIKKRNCLIGVCSGGETAACP